MEDPAGATFAALTLEAQLEHLGRALARGEDRALLARCAGLPDPAPLAWLCARLLTRGFLDDPERATWFARFLVAQSETAVHAALRAAATALTPANAPGFALALVEALRAAPLAKLPAVCVIDRALKHHCPEAWEAFVATHAEDCTVRLTARGAAALTLEDLALLPARAVAALRARADSLGAGALRALDERLEALAREAVAALGAQPKALSQTNAEELLARRVYTDPGHFLIELLQNAEDAGARHWRVSFERARVVVWHDGTPFDARDLVGVTSIGQTTKRKQQIGFFGVGFKSVYEVTDRPQVYSGFYRIEIADVSIPKALAARPGDLPADGTVLVLPLRDPNDPARSARVLYERAAALDPCVLLTLRSIESIEVQLDPGGGGPARQRVYREPASARGRVLLRREPIGSPSPLGGGGGRAFALAERECRYEAGGREAARPDRTRVLVGVRLDEAGVPRVLEAGAATVYSYLPTAERSGLRFFVQGHFDVPVDRERVAEDSAWNRWILAQVPALLADLARDLTDPAATGARKFDAARGLLDVLPLASELPSPAFAQIAAGLRAALADVALLPGTDGALHPPHGVLIASSPVAALFGPESVQGALPDGGAAHLLARTLSPRAVELAQSLGALSFGPADLVALLERVLAPLSDGAAPDAPGTPGFLRGAEPGRLARLYETLAGEFARMERDGAADRVEALLERLRALPIVPDGHGGLHRPPRAGVAGIVRAGGAVRAVLAGLWPFVAHSLDPDGSTEGEADPPPSRAGRMLDRLRVPRMDVGTLVRLLDAGLSPRAGSSSAALATTLRDDPSRARALFAALCDAPREVQHRAARLPLFPAGESGHQPLARDAHDTHGAVLAGGDALSVKLLSHARARRAVIDLREASPELAEFAARAGAATLGADALVAMASRDATAGDADSLRGMRSALRDAYDDLPSKVRASLALLPLWRDRRGRARPLAGEGRALVPAHEDVCALFPVEDFLDEESAALARLGGWGASMVGPDAVADCLAGTEAAPTRLPPGADAMHAAHRYLLAHASEISSAARARLASTPAFLTDRGARSDLASLSRATSPTLRALFRDDGIRRFLDPDSPGAALAHALGLLDRVSPAGTSELLADLAARSTGAASGETAAGAMPFRDPAWVRTLHAHLAAEAASLARTDLERAVALPVFPDATGAPGRLGDVRRGLDRAAVYPCEPDVREFFEAAGVRALDARSQASLAPILESAGIPLAGLPMLVELLRRLPPVQPGQPRSPLQSAAGLARIQQLFVARRDELARRFPLAARPDAPPASTELLGLNVWPTAPGGVVSAARLVDARELLALTEPGTPERTLLDAVRLEDSARACFDALEPLVSTGPATPFLAGLAMQLGRPGASLAEQPRLLSTPARVAAVATHLAPALGAVPNVCVPRVDALGRLRFAALRRADDDAQALLRGTPAAAELLHPDFVASLGPVRLDPESIAPRDVLAAALALPALFESPDLRATLYRWLLERERDVFADPACRDLLARAALFPNERGQRVRAADLVIDPDLPDLGLGWRPADEIPAPLLAALERYLGAGRVPLEQLLERHLMPAYRRAAARGEGETAARILVYVARRLRGRSTAEVRAAVGLDAPDASLPLETADGRFVPARALLLPEPDMAAACRALWGDAYAAPSPARYDAALHPFLRDVGVPALPDLSRVRALLDAPGRGEKLVALATLLGLLHRALGARLAQQLPLTATSWLADGTGCPRPPAELFLWSPEVEALAGNFPELYPDPAAVAALGDPLSRELGFRGARDVRLADVLHHLGARERARGTIPFRVYQWLEQGLAGGWLDTQSVTLSLAERRWVCTDEGAWFNHRHVLGSWEAQYFGARRGYWERGRAECPRLCALFGIAERATPAAVAEFVREVGAEVLRRGDREALRAEPTLPRMLLACFALLGEVGAGVDSSLPVIACTEAGGERNGAEAARRGGGARLVPAASPGLFRSDTPTLESLFSEAGRFLLAARGPAEDRAAIDRFYQAAGVRRLRDAYSVAVDGAAGRDVSAERPSELGALRATLRALAAVMPRVRARRVLPEDEGWVDQARLRPLAAAGAIRAVAGLRVRYGLAGVGEVSRETPAVFDAARGELLIDAVTLEDAEAQATGVALALLPAVYNGPGDEQLADILEILLRLRTRERMSAYLDRRHFPAADAEPGPAEALLERVDAVLDYGLAARLARRFPALGGRDLSGWRDARWVAELGDDALDRFARGERMPAASALAERLLAAAGVGAEAPRRAALAEALAAVLAAPSLSELPPEVFDAHEAAGRQDLLPIEPPTDGARAPWSGAGDPVDASAWIQALASAVRDAAGSSAPPAEHGASTNGSATVPPRSGSAPPDERAPSSNALAFDAASGRAGLLDAQMLGSGGGLSVPPGLGAMPPAPPPGLFRRMLGWFGFGDEPARATVAIGLDAPQPPWLAPDANCLAPLAYIGPQFWATEENRARALAAEPAAWLAYAPALLPPPWTYAVHTLGATFDPKTQSWLPAGAPPLAPPRGARPSGRTVTFRGRLAAGTAVLPVPVFARLAGPVRTRTDTILEPRIDPANPQRVTVRCAHPVDVVYDVELLEVPALAAGGVAPTASAALLEPTVRVEELPSAVRAWLAAEREAGRTPLGRALATQEFVRQNYAYDESALERPEVRRCMARLEPGRGNHHLAVLHATRDRAVLGRGVCYELNVLVVELLRHLDVGALVATGWLFDLGRVDRPDHLFALALLPTPAGPALVPLDATASAHGPRRPLAQPSAPAGLPRVATGPVSETTLAPAPGPWSLDPPSAGSAPGDVDAQLAALARLEAQRAREELALVVLAVRAVCRALGRPEPAALSALARGEGDAASRSVAARALAEELLPDPELLGTLLALLRGDYQHLASLPPRVEDLVRLGVAQVRTVPAFQVVPLLPGPPR